MKLDLTNYKGTEEMHSLYREFVKYENNQKVRYIEVKCKFSLDKAKFSV